MRTEGCIPRLKFLIVRKRVKKHMGRLFVQVVAANATERVTMMNDEEKRKQHDG